MGCFPCKGPGKGNAQAAWNEVIMLTGGERQKLIDELGNDTRGLAGRDFAGGAEPVIVEVPMYPAEATVIDRRTRQQGTIRTQLIRELAVA